MTSAASSSTGEVHNVTCPFCGLVCDDLVVAVAAGGLTVRANGCPISVPSFAHQAAADQVRPRVAGQPATLPQAVAEAARLLVGARQPLFAGLGTDVAGARAVARLAERCGGVVDHMNSAAALRNLRVLQDGGWIATTLSEVRNRADLLVVAGSDIARRFPRFFERTVARRETLFGREGEGGRPCEVVLLGRGPAGAVPPGLPAPTVIPCEVARLAEAFGVLRALVAGRRLDAREAAGVPLPEWQQLAERLRAARYGVIAWAAADFDFPHADLTVQAMCDLVRDLTRATRAAVLPLAGSDGDVTVDTVQLWQTGFGSRTSYGRGYPEYDPCHLSAARLLESGEADVLVWISSFDPRRPPPATDVPTVVLGRPGMAFPTEPAVFIPVGTPGVDHAGHLFRTDRVVALPLRQLRRSELPSAAAAVAAIEETLYPP